MIYFICISLSFINSLSGVLIDLVKYFNFIFFSVVVSVKFFFSGKFLVFKKLNHHFKMVNYQLIIIFSIILAYYQFYVVFLSYLLLEVFFVMILFIYFYFFKMIFISYFMTIYLLLIVLQDLLIYEFLIFLKENLNRFINLMQTNETNDLYVMNAFYFIFQS